MSQSAQNYKNHLRWFPPFHFFVMPVLLLNFLNGARHVWLAPSRSTAFALLVAAALVMLALSARMMVVTVQDRVIRLEMRLRLRELLPPDLRGRINELTRDQLVALRFASDVELTELVRQVLGGELPKKSDIKMKIKNWQADSLRA
jgi:Family of unknown function (DUF6526)